MQFFLQVRKTKWSTLLLVFRASLNRTSLVEQCRVGLLGEQQGDHSLVALHRGQVQRRLLVLQRTDIHRREF